jgi:DNA polymerase-3 subunit alpha
MQDWLRKLKPNSISDLVAMNALYRPGPMEMIGDFIRRKQGAKMEYIHPRLEPILKETYGIIVYQEQVIRIASDVAGFTLAKADLMRRAMGKKDKDLMAKQKTEFIDGALRNGFSKKVSGEIFDMIQKFASYGFNKSHSVAYSVLAYQTAYLKEHYPSEFMAATISAEIGDTDYVVQLIEECRRMNINVLPPDVNESKVKFVIAPTGIRFGLSAIKNVGVSAVEDIIEARKRGGPFSNIFDLCTRVDLRLVNKKTLEGLVQSGAMDGLHKNRARLFEAIEKAIQFGQSKKNHISRGQSSLFEIPNQKTIVENYPPLPDTPEWNEREKLSREKAVLGFYLSGHPLKKHEKVVEAFTTTRLGNSTSVKDGTVVRTAGIISSVKKKVDKKGQMMAFISIEDFTGRAECIVFSDAYRQYQNILNNDAMIMVIGNAEHTGDSLRIIVKEIIPLESVKEKFTKNVVLAVRVKSVNDQSIGALKRIVERHQGKYPCIFNVIHEETEESLLLQATNYGVDLSDDFVTEVENILGPSSVRFSP